MMIQDDLRSRSPRWMGEQETRFPSLGNIDVRNEFSRNFFSGKKESGRSIDSNLFIVKILKGKFLHVALF